MALFGRKRTSIGLDIGSGFVKVVEVDHSGDQPEVTRVAMRPLLPDAIVEGEIMDYGLVSETVQGLFQEMGRKGADVITAIGGHDVIIKKIEMDRMKESDAREVIRWEAEQHVPFDIKSVELDFQILNPHDEGLQMEVLLVAAKRELVDNKVGLLQDAGVNPVIIDVDAFALHNAFEHNYPDDMEGIIALVNVGHETTNVNILEERRSHRDAGHPLRLTRHPRGSSARAGSHRRAGRGRGAGPRHGGRPGALRRCFLRRGGRGHRAGERLPHDPRGRRDPRQDLPQWRRGRGFRGWWSHWRVG